MRLVIWLALFSSTFALLGCAFTQTTEAKIPPVEVPKKSEAPKSVNPAPSPPPKPVVHVVKSADGKIEGEMVGAPIPGSKFFRLQIGMTLEQVEKLIGPATVKDSRITGKQFQPFHFGGDTQRTEVFYKNEGQLTFSNTNPDSAPDTLIRIVINPEARGLEGVPPGSAK